MRAKDATSSAKEILIKASLTGQRILITEKAFSGSGVSTHAARERNAISRRDVSCYHPKRTYRGLLILPIKRRTERRNAFS